VFFSANRIYKNLVSAPRRLVMNKLHAFAVAIIFSTAFASPALAEKTVFTADLKGPSEVPPTDSAGTGKAEVTYDDAGKMFSWSIMYSGLSGKATAAHFHGPAKEGENAGPMVPLTQLDSPMKGSATLTEDQAKALTGGKMYVNVHTAKYPDGEIRGQVLPAK
jgi:hypothetical protein